MALKNKDGTVYKLNRPNPISQKQDFWEMDESKFVLHNCQWTPEMVANDENISPLKSNFHVSEQTAIVEGPMRTAEEEVAVFEKPKQMDIPTPPIAKKQDTLPESQPKPKQPSIPDSVLINSVIFWCLPRSTETQTDDLYGDTYGVERYGKKFTFEGIMLEKGDMGIRFWTNVKQVTKGSIVYPSRYTYRNEEYKDYRWWKVQGLTPKSGGLSIFAIVSEVTPDFSD